VSPESCSTTNPVTQTTWEAWHRAGAWVLIGANAAAGAGSLVAHVRAGWRRRELWAVIVLAQLTAFFQAFVGVVLVTRYDRTLAQLHGLYGFTAIIAVGVLYSYRTSPFMRGKEYLLYGLGCLFIMGLGIRELFLAGR
jgi:hypothetical protein